MALPPRLFLPEGLHDSPGSVLATLPARNAPSESTPTSAQGPSLSPRRLRRRALWRGEAGLPDQPVLVEWFPAAELPREQGAARRLRGLCHVHLLRLLHIGAADGRSAYAVSEAPDGVDLFNVLRAAPGELPAWWGVAVAQAVARALLAVEQHLSRGRRRGGGHGRVHLGTVFVGWDGSVRLLAFSPHPSASSQKEDAIAPELRLSDRLLTPAADVYALGALLRELLPPSLQRRPMVATLLSRCLLAQADKRLSLSALAESLGELLVQLQAPLGLCGAIGEVLGQCCPRATVDLLHADWAESTDDGYPALPPTLAPLAPSAVLLSPTWLREAQKPARRPSLFSLALPGAVGLCAGLLFLAAPALSPAPTRATSAPAAGPPALVAADSESTKPALSIEKPRAELRLSILRLRREPSGLQLLVRITNPSAQPIAPDLSRLRLLASGQTDPQRGLAPLFPPSLTVGAGRFQDVELRFPSPAGAASLPLPAARAEAELRFLPLRDASLVPK